jgi:hypothetical protein
MEEFKMQKIKTISERNCETFDLIVQKFLNDGYEIKSSFCGLIHYYDGSTDPIYKAILLKEEE